MAIKERAIRFKTMPIQDKPLPDGAHAAMVVDDGEVTVLYQYDCERSELLDYLHAAFNCLKLPGVE